MTTAELIRVRPNEVERAAEAIRVHGCVLVEDAVPSEPLRLLRECMDTDSEELLAYCETIGGNPRDRGHLQQGPPKSADFVFSDVAMNPYVNAICCELYQNRPRLTFYNGNTNYPNSTTQHLHMDGVHHTKEPEPVHDPVSVVVNIPPQPMDASNGAIQIWPGSHRLRASKGGNAIDPEKSAQREIEVPPIQPTTQLGDVLIRDVRLWHRGVPNPTNRARHMIALILTSGALESEHPLETKRQIVFEKGCEQALENPLVDANAKYVDGPVEYLISPTKRIYEARQKAAQESANKG